MTSLAVAEGELQAVSGSGVDDSVNSASGVIARKLSNELKDLAAVAETEQDVLHVLDWSDERVRGRADRLVLICSRNTSLR